MFYGTGTRPEKVLTKNIRQVRNFKDRILCPRTMATYAFFMITFFSNIDFFLILHTKRRNKRLKLCEKKMVGHHTCLGENNLLIIWPTYPQRKPLGSDCACARARTNDGRNYAQ